MSKVFSMKDYPGDLPNRLMTSPRRHHSLSLNPNDARLFCGCVHNSKRRMYPNLRLRLSKTCILQNRYEREEERRLANKEEIG